MKTYTLTTPAYGQEPGTTLALDDTDPLVQMNVESWRPRPRQGRARRTLADDLSDMFGEYEASAST